MNPSSTPLARSTRRVSLPVGLLLAGVFAPAATGRPAGAVELPADQVTICSQEWIAEDPAGAPAMSGPPLVSPDADRDGLWAAQARGQLSDAEPHQDINAGYVIPNDTAFWFGQPNMKVIRAPDAWGVSYGADDVTVAVISTGVDLDNDDLRPKLWINHGEVPGNGIDDDNNGYVDDVQGWNFHAQDNVPMDFPTGVRGTMDAGIAAAATHNKKLVAGVSWGARIMPLRVSFPDPEGRVVLSHAEHVTEAICYAANNGARVILVGGWFFNLAPTQIFRMQDAITYAHQRAGAVVVASAGDCGHDGLPRSWCPEPENGVRPPIYPAHLQHVIGVQSVSAEGLTQHQNASHGPWVDISAPGERFWTTGLVSQGGLAEVLFSNVGGATSNFAAAHIAGAAALMLSVNPDLSPLRVEEQLCRSANRTVGGPYPFEQGQYRNDRYGCGVLHLEQAVDTMDWKLSVTPTDVVQYTDGEHPWPQVRFESSNLNQGTWSLETNSPWLRCGAVNQETGERAWAVCEADLEELAVEGGRLQAGDVYTVPVRACPLPRSKGACTAIGYRLRVVNTVSSLYMPWSSRR